MKIPRRCRRGKGVGGAQMMALDTWVEEGSSGRDLSLDKVTIQRSPPTANSSMIQPKFLPQIGGEVRDPIATRWPLFQTPRTLALLLLSRGEGSLSSVWTLRTCSVFLSVRKGGSSASPFPLEVEEAGILKEISDIWKWATFHYYIYHKILILSSFNNIKFFIL